MKAYERSAEFAQAVLGRIAPSTHTNPSGCEGWDVAEAINHLIGGQHYFTMCAHGKGLLQPDGDPPDFAAADPVEAHRIAAQGVAESFTPQARESMLETFRGTLPGSVLLNIAIMENVVHALDVARGAGVDAEVPDDLAPLVLQVVEQASQAGGEDFAEPLEAPADATPTQQVLAASGRRP